MKSIASNSRLECVLLVVVFGIGLPGCQKTEPDKVARSRAIGEQIIEAIYEFENKNEKLPSNLDELVSEFLPEILNPLTGRKGWGYTPLGKRDFTFSFEEDSVLVLPGVHFWDCDRDKWRFDSQ